MSIDVDLWRMKQMFIRLSIENSSISIARDNKITTILHIFLIKFERGMSQLSK